MALSRASQVGSRSNEIGGSAYGTTAWVTASFTPPDSSLLVAFVGLASETDISATDPTIAGGSLTWTPRASVQTNASGYFSKLHVFTAPVTTGASMTVSVDHAASVHTWQVHVFSETGYDVASPIGATGSTAALADGAGTLTLSGSPASTSEVIAARFLTVTTVVLEQATEGAGWAELYDLAHGDGQAWGGMQTQARGSSTSSTVAWVDTCVNGTIFTNIGAAIEIKEAAAAGHPTMRRWGGVPGMGYKPQGRTW